MLSVEEAKAKFAEILNADPSWSPLANSQLSKHISVFMAWALRDAQFKVERDRQEFFLSTALNKSSIQAHAEDREYIPIKPVPSSGSILAANSGPDPVSIPYGTELTLSNDTIVTTTEAKTIPANGTVAIAASQKERVSYQYSVDAAVEFFECLVPLENTSLVSEFSVSVSDPQGNTSPYAYYRLLQNTYSDTLAYDEFYSHSGQLGIRFGNGNFGAIPEAGSVVNISTWETKGNIYIASGQKVYLVNALTTADVLKFTVSTAFSGGSDAEDIESIRTNLHYWQTYNNEMIWAEDYKYYLKRKFSDILFAEAWGEQEQEEQEGSPSFDYVNKIYISAYAPGTDVHAEYMSELEKVRQLNRSFVWIPVNHVKWTVSLTGTVLDDVSLVEAETAIRTALDAAYGVDSSSRRGDVFTSEIYDLIMDTGYFEAKSGARFSLTTSGTTVPAQLQDMVSIDLENSTISLSYA